MNDQPADDTTQPKTTTPTIDTEAIAAAFGKLSDAMKTAAITFTVQGVMGAVWTGDVDRARDSLHRMSTDQLQQVRLAALTLAALAEAIEAEGPTA